MSARGLMFVMALATLLAACGQDRSVTSDNPQQARAASPPDITGMWQPVGIRGGANPTQSGDGSLAGQPPQPEREFTPEYQARHAENQKRFATAESGAFRADPNSHAARMLLGQCPPYGMPTMMEGDFVESMDIVQAKNYLTLVVETTDTIEVRRIWLDREQLPLDDVDPGYFGRSVGKWEGDVLVVNTIGIMTEPTSEHSEQMVITERISLRDGKLIDDVTVTDPVALKKPWSYSHHYERVMPANYEPPEGVCENSDQYRLDEKGNLIVG